MEPLERRGASPHAKNVYAKIPALLKVSKLTISDIAYLVNVSRPTVYSWIENTTTPRGVKKQRLDYILKAIHTAYKISKLPFPVRPMNAKVRRQALTDVITDTVNVPQ